MSTEELNIYLHHIVNYGNYCGIKLICNMNIKVELSPSTKHTLYCAEFLEKTSTGKLACMCHLRYECLLLKVLFFLIASLG